MERVDSASARFPDRHVRKLMMGLKGGEIIEEVPGTYTPPYGGDVVAKMPV